MSTEDYGAERPVTHTMCRCSITPAVSDYSPVEEAEAILREANSP